MRKNVAALFAILLIAVVPLSSSTRIGAGGGFLCVNGSGYPLGSENGIKRSSSSTPSISLEAEISPSLDFAIILKADAAPFNPSILSKGEILPSVENAVDQYTLTGSLSIGTGWQLPISYWAYVDSPFEVTVGGVVSAGLVHISYDTPDTAFSSSEFILSAGFFESASFYFGTVGLTLSSLQSFTFADFSSWETKPTGGAAVSGNAFIITPVMFNWNVSLGLSFRFGY